MKKLSLRLQKEMEEFKKNKKIPQITTESREAAAQDSLSQLVPGKTNTLSWTGTRDTNNKMDLDDVGILLVI